MGKLSHLKPCCVENLVGQPAQLLYKTGGTFADGFWEVDLINALNGGSETLYWVRAAEWEPGEISVCLSPSLQSNTGENNVNRQSCMNRKKRTYRSEVQTPKHPVTRSLRTHCGLCLG